MNSVFAGFFANMTTGSKAVYMLVEDEDSGDGFCIIRGYLMYSGASLIYHSVLLQTFHRLFVNVLPNRRYLQTKIIFVPLVIVQWLISLTFA